jgi:hypothetical protein
MKSDIFLMFLNFACEAEPECDVTDTEDQKGSNIQINSTSNKPAGDS